MRRVASNQRSASPIHATHLRQCGRPGWSPPKRPPKLDLGTNKTCAQSGAVSEANLRCGVHAPRVKTSVHSGGNLGCILEPL